MRASKTHINLVFTKRDYQHQGVATALFRFLLEDILPASDYVIDGTKDLERIVNEVIKIFTED